MPDVEKETEKGYIMLNSMQMDDSLEIGEVLNISFDRSINFNQNGCGYSGSDHDIMFNLVQPLFLKYKTASIKEDNPNFCQATNILFADKYWKVSCKEIGIWEVTRDVAVVGWLGSGAC